MQASTISDALRCGTIHCETLCCGKLRRESLRCEAATDVACGKGWKSSKSWENK